MMILPALRCLHHMHDKRLSHVLLKKSAGRAVKHTALYLACLYDRAGITKSSPMHRALFVLCKQFAHVSGWIDVVTLLLLELVLLA